GHEVHGRLRDAGVDHVAERRGDDDTPGEEPGSHRTCWGPRMAPRPPTLGRTPAKPWRASVPREIVLPRQGARSPTLGRTPAEPWRASVPREIVLPRQGARAPAVRRRPAGPSRAPVIPESVLPSRPPA